MPTTPPADNRRIFRWLEIFILVIYSPLLLPALYYLLLVTASISDQGSSEMWRITDMFFILSFSLYALYAFAFIPEHCWRQFLLFGIFCLMLGLAGFAVILFILAKVTVMGHAPNERDKLVLESIPFVLPLLIIGGLKTRRFVKLFTAKQA